MPVSVNASGRVELERVELSCEMSEKLVITVSQNESNNQALDCCHILSKRLNDKVLGTVLSQSLVRLL